jgi:hypothetical protein
VQIKINKNRRNRMGMYTEIFVNVDLKNDTPISVIEVLTAMCNKDSDAKCLKDKPNRWSLMFNNGSYYHPLTECGRLTCDEISGHYSLIAKGDIKNYDSEIEQFFDYIAPWCENDFMGYHKYEEDREPTLVYKAA